MPAVPRIEPGEVDGEEARSVQGVGAAEGQRGDGERGHRVQARGGQRHAPQRPRGGDPHHEADARPIPSWRTKSTAMSAIP